MIPVLTTLEGASLTSAQWQDAQIEVVSCHLVSLLVKPGLAVLNTFADLKSYMGWPGMIALNASMQPPDAQGMYTIRSPYDGSLIRHAAKDILNIIAHLQPQLVILPVGISKLLGEHDLPQSTLLFLPANDLPSSNMGRLWGIYFPKEQQKDWQQIRLDFTERPCYVAGDFTIEEMRDFVSLGIQYLESNCAAAAGYVGKVYCHEGMISLSDNQYALQFDPLDLGCACPTCTQGLTRAYLHHLLAQTPLLAQRFLIQHNIFYWQTQIKQIKLHATSFT